MAIKVGEKVKVVSRPLTDQDASVHAFFQHMQGMTGVVENIYSKDEIAIKVDLDCLPAIQAGVHKAATARMREKFTDSVGEEGRKGLEKHELEFVPHYMLLLREADLEKI
ncbi:MAG: hypothetical protein AB7F50_08500 [Fimbriimonadaceae bacterium]